MISIFELWSDAINILNTQQLGHMRPRNFNTYVRDAENQLMKDLYEEFQKTQSISDSLYPFLVSVNIAATRIANSPFSIIKYPPDYYYHATTRILMGGDTTCACEEYKTFDSGCAGYIDPDKLALEKLKREDAMVEREVKLVNNSKWSSAMEHQTKKPKITNPAMTQLSGGFKVAPGSISVVQMDYFRKPVKAVFAFTLQAVTDLILYNSTDSVDLEWPEAVKPYFLKFIVMKHAAFVKDETTFQASQATVKV